MKCYFFLFCATSLSFLCNAQSKAGNNWLLGYPPEPGFEVPYSGGSVVRFTDIGVDTSRFTAGGFMSVSSSISDSTGKLLFYTNGCEMYNREYQIMLNGNAISAGESYDLTCTGATGIKGYGEFQLLMTLPWPHKADKYVSAYIFLNKPNTLLIEVHFSTIDMTLDNGKGGVVDKNLELYSDKVLNGFMNATRHGNGIDWWVTFPEYQSSNYLSFLLDSTGLHPPAIQDVGFFSDGCSGHGQSAFSPDGTKYAEVCFFRGQVMDFDRCTGKFSHARVIDFETTGDPANEENGCAGVAFSPDSRFMYVSRCDSLYQYDMLAKDFNSSRQTIAWYDGQPDTTGMRASGFYTLLTAPDDKIYINMSWSTKALHVIHHPNEKGLACGFQKWGLELPTLHYGQLPNMPNFKLGAANPACINCDTTVHKSSFTLFPNPAQSEVLICRQGEVQTGPFTFELYDALGRLMLEDAMETLPHRVYLNNLPEAGYFYRIFGNNGERLSNGTLVKVHE
jgi:hypothetical protein